MSEVVNHEEAYLLACEKESESNLARCYLDIKAQRDKLLDANADLLKQLSNYQIDWESQEDLLEQLYWAFVEDRENEKSSFKEKMKFFAGQINQYANELIAALRTKRQPLSDTEIQKLYMEASLVDSGFVNHFARLVEKAHGIK